MEDDLKRKDDELQSVLDGQRGKDISMDIEKKEWADLRRDLENKVSDAQNLNDTLQEELDRVRASQSDTERDLRSQIEDLQVSVESSRGMMLGNPDLERENEELRAELKEQQEITDEVRTDAQEFLREMRMLSDRSSASYEREAELESIVNRLEDEVKDWRNRYARTKTQLRSLRASSIGLTIADAAKYAQESGFTQDNGLVKDVHVTKFQISIDELLQTARSNDPARVIDFMKTVIVNVRRISQDIDEAPKSGGDLAQKQAKLRSRISATANNLITASKNYAGAKGLSPVSLLDAAASHLTSAVVELVRTVKIRPTPAGELEDDDDGKLEPVDKTGMFSREAKKEPVRQQENVKPLAMQNGMRQSVESSRQSTNGFTRQSADMPRQSLDSERESLNGYVPGPFLGLRNGRNSNDSSLYSPINSPRESVRPKSSGKDALRPSSRGNGLMNGANGINGSAKPLPLALQSPRGPPTPQGPPAPMTVGFGIRSQNSDVEELKV